MVENNIDLERRSKWGKKFVRVYIQATSVYWQVMRNLRR